MCQSSSDGKTCDSPRSRRTPEPLAAAFSPCSSPARTASGSRSRSRKPEPADVERMMRSAGSPCRSERGRGVWTRRGNRLAWSASVAVPATPGGPWPSPINSFTGYRAPFSVGSPWVSSPRLPGASLKNPLEMKSMPHPNIHSKKVVVKGGWGAGGGGCLACGYVDNPTPEVAVIGRHLDRECAEADDRWRSSRPRSARRASVRGSGVSPLRSPGAAVDGQKVVHRSRSDRIAAEPR